MTHLLAAISQQYSRNELATAVRATLGKPLRRATALTQLALVGALACLPEDRRRLPTALLWQTTHGPRHETIALLEEVCLGAAEPMPYDFLATQPTIAAAQIQPFLPGLQSATIFQLDTEGAAQWALLLSLAANWLTQGRYAQILCAHLISTDDRQSGHWLALGATPPEIPSVRLHFSASPSGITQPDTPDFPLRLERWLSAAEIPELALQSPEMPMLAVKFTRT